MNAVTFPEIRINFSNLFYDDICRQLDKVQTWELPSPEQCEEWVEVYREEWAKSESRILTALQDITGLTFYKKVIDVTVAPGVIPKSDPLFLSFKDRPKEVVETLTHELIHVLLTDNTILSIYGNYRDKSLKDEWIKLFGDIDDFNMLVHIPVHAIHKMIWIDVLNDQEGPKRDMENMKKLKATSYLKSWDYVDEHGYVAIIEQLKKSYQKIAVSMEKKS